MAIYKLPDVLRYVQICITRGCTEYDSGFRIKHM